MRPGVRPSRRLCYHPPRPPRPGGAAARARRAACSPARCAGWGGRSIVARNPDAYLVVPGRELRGPDRWEEVFGRPGPLAVEIGFGKDEFLLRLAETDPEGNYLGIDFSRPRARSYLRKIRRRGLANVRVLLEHAATALGHCLGDRTVREYHVLFPDPWPKKRHAAHRLVSPWFAREAARTLVPGGRVRLATDDPAYRDQMIGVMEGHGAFRNELGPGRTGSRPEGLDPTIFELRWRGKGRDIFYLGFTREGRS